MNFTEYTVVAKTLLDVLPSRRTASLSPWVLNKGPGIRGKSLRCKHLPWPHSRNDLIWRSANSEHLYQKGMQ